MRTLFTFLIFLLACISMQAQDIVRNGGFELNDGGGTIAGLDFWHIDKETPSAGVGGDVGDYHVYLAGDDSTLLYQVIDIVSADSMIYDVSLEAENTWQAEVLVITACTSDADSSVRTVYSTDTIPFDVDYLPNVLSSFAFAPGSEFEGKKLIIGFEILPAGGWVNIDDVSVTRKAPGENTKPIAYAGDNQRVVGGELVTLDGSGSTDPDGDVLTYNWVSQFPGISLSDPNAEQPTFTAPNVNEISVYNFALWVNDGQVNSDTSFTSVVVVPAGELIRNGDFSARNPEWETTYNLKELHHWYLDIPFEEVTGGIWDMTMIHLTTTDPALYQVVDEVGTDTAIYTLTFSAKTSWYCEYMNSVFSVSEADTSVRTQINLQENMLEFDAGTETGGDFVVYQHVYTIPANSANVGKNLMVEFQPTLLDNDAEVTTGWAQLEYVSLVKQVITTSGIETQNLINAVVYPNPSDDYISIAADQPINKVSMFSLTGQLIRSIEEADIQTIDISDLDAGIYMLSLTSGDNTSTRKLIIE